MGYQPEGNVMRIPRELFAKEELPFYRIGKLNTDETISLADAGEKPFCIIIPSTENDRVLSDGTVEIRDSYLANEIPEAIVSGIGYVELGETVSPGEYCVPGANGVGMAGESELTALDAGDLAGAIGMYLDAGDSGDIVRVITNR